MLSSRQLRALFVFTVASLTARSGAGTTVVGISTNDSIFLGADSIIASDGANAIGRRCKIDVGGTYAAAMAGPLADSATSFDAATYVRSALRTPGDLAQKVRTFELLIREPLQRSLDYGRHHAPEVFAARYSGKKALQIIFGGVEARKAKMIVSTFRVAENGGLVVDEPKTLGSGQVYVFGESAAIARYRTANPGLDCG